MRPSCCPAVVLPVTFVLLSFIVFSSPSPSPQLPFICKVRKVDCERRPGSICCRDQKRPSLDNLAQLEDEPGDDIEGGQDAGKLVQIASNIHEVVVKPNGEPIKEAQSEQNLSAENDPTGTNLTSTEITTTTSVTSPATTSSTITTTQQNIPAFCLKLKFNCKLFSFHKCCKYNLKSSTSSTPSPTSPSSSSSSSTFITSEAVKINGEEVSTENYDETEDFKSNRLTKKDKSPFLFDDNKRNLEKTLEKEAKGAKEATLDTVANKKTDGSNNPFKYSKNKKSKFFSSRKKTTEKKSLYSPKRKRTGLCKIINCRRSKNHYCCKDLLQDQPETTTAAAVTSKIPEDSDKSEKNVTVIDEKIIDVTSTTTTTSTTTMKPYEAVAQEETTMESVEVEDEDEEENVFSGSGEEEGSDISEAVTTQGDTSTMMSYPDYTQLGEDDVITTEATNTDQTEETSEPFEEVTEVSKSISESYEETRIWYDGINEAGEFVDKYDAKEDWRYRDVNGERIVQVYPVYVPAKSYSQHNDVDNEVLSNNIEDHHDKHESVDIRNEITCHQVDCLAWPSNKCCSPHVTKKRHSNEEINDKITATIVRIVKSVRWV